MKNFSSLFLLFILFTSTANAQGYDPAKVNKKARTFYEQAGERAQDGSLTLATGLLQQAIQADSNFAEAWLALAGIQSNLRSYTAGRRSYEKAFAIDSVYTIDYRGAYASLLARTGEFDKALQAVSSQLNQHPPKNQTALDRLKKQQSTYQFAVQYAKDNPVKNYVFAPKNLGEGVNSIESEYFPFETLEGGTLLFTRRLHGTNEDFFQSSFQNGKWQTAAPLMGPINSRDNEAAPHISTDGEMLVFTANYPEGAGNYDIYMATKTAMGWSAPENLGPRVNSDQWDSQPCLSPDKKDLYFSSQRFGGFGGKDLYVCHRLPQGSWSAPENLGPGINTAGNEECPFIHADNQSLYFTSNGWPGYGANDLFVARKQPDGSWGKPKNMGYPINTVNDEGTLFIAADGVTAYYASDREDSYGGLDIYQFELRADLRPLKTLWVKGHVSDAKTQAGLSCTVELTDLSTGQAVSITQTDANGDYLVTLPVGKDYAFNVNKTGYLFYSDQFMLAKRSPDSTYEKNIALQPLVANASIELKNIFFESNKAQLNPASYSELDKLVKLLNDNPALRIEISGHTDNVGKPADNLVLSNNRAKAVTDYLLSKKILANRIQAKGYGETQPVAPNNTEEGRARNRRTVMKVLAN